MSMQVPPYVKIARPFEELAPYAGCMVVYCDKGKMAVDCTKGLPHWRYADPTLQGEDFPEVCIVSEKVDDTHKAYWLFPVHHSETDHVIEWNFPEGVVIHIRLLNEQEQEWAREQNRDGKLFFREGNQLKVARAIDRCAEVLSKWK